MSKKLKKVWVTKYALTTGVFNVMAEVEKDDKIAFVPKNYETGAFAQCFHGNDWYITEKEALKRGEEMRTKKITSLKKQISKLEKMEF